MKYRLDIYDNVNTVKVVIEVQTKKQAKQTINQLKKDSPFPIYKIMTLHRYNGFLYTKTYFIKK